jgi:hypothetical protein
MADFPGAVQSIEDEATRMQPTPRVEQDCSVHAAEVTDDLWSRLAGRDSEAGGPSFSGNLLGGTGDNDQRALAHALECFDAFPYPLTVPGVTLAEGSYDLDRELPFLDGSVRKAHQSTLHSEHLDPERAELPLSGASEVDDRKATRAPLERHRMHAV